MKKRILTLVAALALAATVAVPVQAASGYSTSDLGAYTSSGLKDKDASIEKDATNTITDTLSSKVSSDNKDLKPSGASNAKVNVVTGNAKDNLMDNGIKPAVKEFVKVSRKGETDKGKVGVESLRGIHYFDLTADAPGDVTFKVDVSDGYNSAALDGDSYAIVLHYTGNAADADGITAQYCKISSAGKVTAHFNSFSPVAIIVTTSHSAQALVNTYSHSAGSDAGNAAATTTTPATVQAPVVDPNAAVAAPADAAGAAAANGKGAASPKTSDNAYALYLILAVAAVAGTTLVATKKTR